MSIRVTITNDTDPESDSNAIRYLEVRLLHADGTDPGFTPTILKGGESFSFGVHGNNQLKITEVERV